MHLIVYRLLIVQPGSKKQEVNRNKGGNRGIKQHAGTKVCSIGENIKIDLNTCHKANKCKIWLLEKA